MEVTFFCLKNASIRWRSELSRVAQSFYIDGVLRARPLFLSDFFVYSRKNYSFKSVWITFCMLLKIFKSSSVARGGSGL